jgi:hypothetical protein
MALALIELIESYNSFKVVLVPLNRHWHEGGKGVGGMYSSFQEKKNTLVFSHKISIILGKRARNE